MIVLPFSRRRHRLVAHTVPHLAGAETRPIPCLFRDDNIPTSRAQNIREIWLGRITGDTYDRVVVQVLNAGEDKRACMIRGPG